MPRATDSDLNRESDGFIVLAQFVDCEECGATIEVRFQTPAQDEDGLADLEPGDLTQEVECTNCGHVFEAAYDGWLMHGEAG
jgi:uncharacterized Zn finger protein